MVNSMSTLLKIVLIVSILLNLLAIWGMYHYIRYGGSPLGELKRFVLGAKTKPAVDNSQDETDTFIRKQVAEGVEDSLRVVFYGASITNNWDLDKYFPEIHAVNKGVGGYAKDLLVNFKHHVLELKPAAVVIKLCAINFKPHIPRYILEDCVIMMVEAARRDSIKPVLCTVIPAAKPSAHIRDYSIKDSLADFNTWIRDYAESNSLPLIDYAESISDENGFLPRKYAKDPVHLNETGYELVSGIAKPVVYEQLGLMKSSGGN
jgi:hypothetical protein